MSHSVGKQTGGLAVIGGGVMGEVVIKAALDSFEPAAIRVVDKRPERAAELRDELGVQVTDDVVHAADGARGIVIAVKPQDVPDVLRELAECLREGQTVISVAVGLSAASYEEALPDGTPVVRVMPNTPATVGAGVAAISPGAHAGEDDLALTEQILAPTGLVVRVPEKQQDAVMSISGSGPGYLFYIIDALAEAGVLHGLPRPLAQQLAAHTVAGAGLMARESGEHPVVLRERVSSPGGTTVAALRALDEAGVRAAFLAATSAAIERSREIAQG